MSGGELGSEESSWGRAGGTASLDRALLFLRREWSRAGARCSGRSNLVAKSKAWADATFFLAMAMFPECQKEAQEEIDKLLGQADGSGIECLPLFSDRDHMPYMEAVLTE